MKLNKKTVKNKLWLISASRFGQLLNVVRGKQVPVFPEADELLLTCDSLKQATDQALVKLYLETESERVIGELYRRYAGKVFGTCFSILKNREEAEDAAMEVFEKVMRNLPSSKPLYFSTWLFTITRNHCLSIIRKDTKVTVVDLTDGNFAFIKDETPQQLILGLDQMPEKLVAVAIEQLPSKQAACIRLFYFAEKSYQEIAKDLGMELKEVKSHLQNGKRNLAQVLGQWYHQNREA